jgi:aspartyl-tRNA(Asn)/glutamyl-tRNA(Gln) amidotransferase subunit A
MGSDSTVELAGLSLVGAAALLQRGAISSVELTQAYLERIEAADPLLGAWARVYPELALRAATEADARRTEGSEPRSALDGIPIGLKDTIAVAGVPRTLGSDAFVGAVPSADATVWRALRRDGMILLGHNTTQELALGNAPQLVSNPWDPDHSPGGSSNGGGAAVRAGMAPAAIGTDVGGSLRRPASACGVSTFVPTAGAVPLAGIHSFDLESERVGPLARSVVDCAMLAATIAKPAADRNALLAVVGVDDPAALRGARLARLRSDEEAAPIADLIDGFEAELGGRGAEIVDIVAPRLPAVDPRPRGEHVEFFGGCNPDRVRRLSPYARSFGTETLLRAEREGTVSRSRERAVRARYRREWKALFSELALDAILVPSQLAETPALVTVRDEGDLLGFGDPTIRSMWNLAGTPVVGLPIGITPAGMPIGAQLVGPPNRDSALLGIAAAYQSVTDHHQKESPDFRSRL